MSDDDEPAKRNYALVVKNKKILFVSDGNYHVPSLNGYTSLEDIGKYLVNEFDIYGKYRGTMETEDARIFVFHCSSPPKKGEFLGLNEFLNKKLDETTGEIIIPEAIRRGFLT